MIIKKYIKNPINKHMPFLVIRLISSIIKIYKTKIKDGGNTMIYEL